MLAKAKMPIFCLCGLEAGSRISRKENINKGRKYFSCSQLEENKCKFFKWEESNTLLLRKQPMPIVSNPISRSSSTFTDSERTVQIYTDGSCIGNQNVKVSFCPAGWGLVVIVARAAGDWNILEELYGPVVLDTTSPFFLGATVGSNNTAELSAIGEALLWLENNNNPAEYPAAVIHYDSEYAAKSVTGEFNGPKNRPLYLKIRDILHRLTAASSPDRMRITFEHVKGHSSDRWNDRADKLANKGSSGMICSSGRYGSGSAKAGFSEKESCDGSIGTGSKKGGPAVKDDSPNKKVKAH